MDYKNLKFEQAAFCFMMLYQGKELRNETMEQLVEHIYFESIVCCNYDKTNNSTYQKVNAVVMLVCLERTGYILSECHMKNFRKWLETPENRSLFNNVDWEEYQADIKTANAYLNWSEGKNCQSFRCCK